MGDYLRTTTNTYIVSEEDVKKFEALISDKSKSTKDVQLRYLWRALAELAMNSHQTGSGKRLRERETPNIARHTANSLKLFIKTVVREIFFFIFDTVTFGTSSC